MAPSNIPKSCGMFHTFQGVAPRKPSSGSPGSPRSGTSGNKRITTPHACAECKRRKIRCDGKQPCGQCLSSRPPKTCFYDKHRQRVIPSRKTLDALSQSLEECRYVLRRLYPNHQVSTLLPLSRNELVNLLNNHCLDTTALPSPTLTTSPTEPSASFGTGVWDWCDGHHSSQVADSSEPLKFDLFDPDSDRKAPYLNASSIRAALLVMLKIQPSLRDSLATSFPSFTLSANVPSTNPQNVASLEGCRSWSWRGQSLIDTYFSRVHALLPMLEEASFRRDYLEGTRVDSAWECLVNVVFAISDMVSTKSDGCSHSGYFNRAMELMTADSLDHGQIETVQSLALIGGFYLQNTNQNAMANTVIRAALRMARGLGLHRCALAQQTSSGWVTNLKSRTWYSLFCIDTWSATSMGRLSSILRSLDADLPLPELSRDESSMSNSDAELVTLVETVKFCQIAKRFQEVLAVTPLLDSEDRRTMDAELLKWHSQLPWLLRSPDSYTGPLHIARCVMNWRYQNLRMLLYRPALLSMAANDANIRTGTYDEDAAVVEICREMAASTIEDVSREWARSQMVGWQAVWFLYQAAMIPLVSIYWQGGSPAVPEWQRQIHTLLDVLEAMEESSITARHSREVVQRLYEARYQSPNEHVGTGNWSGIEFNADVIDPSLQRSSLSLDTEQLATIMDAETSWDLESPYCDHLQKPLHIEDEVCPQLECDITAGVGITSLYMDGISMEAFGFQ